MPAEWERHRSTWLSWPKNKSTWPGGLLKEVESIYFRMIAALLPHEKVNLLVDDQKTAKQVLNALGTKRIPAQNLIFHHTKTTDTWIRDYGPIFVKRVIARSEATKQSDRSLRLPRAFGARNDVAYIKWIFNAWGGKYADLAKDNQVVERIGALKNIQRFDARMIFEGGSIDVNGRGAGLTTEQCLLNPNRNAKLPRKAIEQYLKNYLGITKVIWLRQGIEGDDTDGHVDDITRFVGPRALVTAAENDSSDKNHAILKGNLEILRSESDQEGRRFHLVELPMPGKIYSGGAAKRRLPASYANFYIANAVVLVPLYSHRNDKLALKIIKSVFPRRKVIGLDCSALVYGLGSIHCVTQQEPA